jgi:hypothetical protein
VGENWRFGAWGWCQIAGNNVCSGTSVGYPLGDQITFLARRNVHINGNLNSLTSVNILTPITTGITFLAMLVAWMSNKMGFFFASFLSLLAFLVSFSAMVTQFVTYGSARNSMWASGLGAEYGAGMWMILAATIVLLLAAFFAFFQCCCGDSRKRNVVKNEPTAVA